VDANIANPAKVRNFSCSSLLVPSPAASIYESIDVTRLSCQCTANSDLAVLAATRVPLLDRPYSNVVSNVTPDLRRPEAAPAALPNAALVAGGTDGTALECEFNEYAVGCWGEGAKFTGCYAVGDDGDWKCVWNSPVGDSED
jgi:hypothetical protein